MAAYRAARVVGPGTVEIVEQVEPDLAPGEVLVRTHIATICGSDLHVVFAPDDPDVYPMPLGYPGHEAVGQVLRSASPDFAPGDYVLQLPDRAYCHTFAELHRTSDRFLIALPDGSERLEDYLQAQQLGTVIFALRRFLPPEDRRRVATVVGLGSAGLHFVQMLQRFGFETVVAADVVGGRVDFAARLGAMGVVASSDDPAAVISATLKASDGRGADLVIDASSTNEGRTAAMLCAGRDGSVGFFGLPDSEMVPLPFGEVFRRNITMHTAVAAQHDPGIPTFHEALELICSGEVESGSMVTHRFDLEQLPQALALAHSYSDGVIKIAINLRPRLPLPRTSSQTR